jgi:hypothetical protein
MQYQGIGGLIVLIADVWAKKVIWTVLIVLLPVLGFVLWFFLGPKSGRA